MMLSEEQIDEAYITSARAFQLWNLVYDSRGSKKGHQKSY